MPSTKDDSIKKFREAEKNLAEARRKYEDSRVKAQIECGHPVSQILEGHYSPELEIRPPEFRVCTDCGLAEDGWRSYTFLGKDDYGRNGKVRRVDAHEALSYLHGRVLTADEISEFERRKINLEALIRGNTPLMSKRAV